MRAKFINEKFTEKTDPIQDMGIGIVAKMREKTKDWDVYDLSNYLDDECKHLKKYIYRKRTYEMPMYEKLPMKELTKLGFRKSMLNRINKNTGHYEGAIYFNDDGTIDIYSGD